MEHVEPIAEEQHDSPPDLLVDVAALREGVIPWPAILARLFSRHDPEVDLRCFSGFENPQGKKNISISGNKGQEGRGLFLPGGCEVVFLAVGPFDPSKLHP